MTQIVMIFLHLHCEIDSFSLGCKATTAAQLLKLKYSIAPVYRSLPKQLWDKKEVNLQGKREQNIYFLRARISAFKFL